jgi:hypothetical protein
MIELRNTNFTGNAEEDAALSGENARDTNAALSERVAGGVFGPFVYVAVGATTAEIPIKCPNGRPQGVLLINCYATSAPSSLVSAVGALNFRWDGGTMNAYVTEPSGLSANTSYGLTFLVVG